MIFFIAQKKYNNLQFRFFKVLISPLMKHKLLLLLSLAFFGTSLTSEAQTLTAPNIDFETGTSACWTYWRGTNTTPGPVWTLATCAPAMGLHTLTNSSMGTDPYGGFSVVGDGLYSLKLSKDTSNDNADGASYNIHVPATGHFNITYRYAIVFQNPGHSPSQQPRFQISVTDSATGTGMPCYSYSFVSSGTLPGFSLSSMGLQVWYKPWTAGSLNLTGMGGKTAVVTFKVGGCTMSGHWGYAYIDMNATGYGLLSSKYVACHTTTDTLFAPIGDSLYKWTDSATCTASYGTTQTVILAVPSVTTTYAVILTPHYGYGCTDTLYTRVIPPLKTHQSHDTTICSGASLSLTSGATGYALPFTYSWTPSTGLSCTTCDPVTAIPPSGTTAYKVTVTDASGCTIKDTINITASPAPGAISGVTGICIGYPATLSDAVGGGAWNSGNTAVATIGSLTGIVTGLSTGTSVITYKIGSCSVFATITVNTAPGTITGVTGICSGSTAALSDAVSGGSWTSGNTTVATIGLSTGIVTGLSAGTAAITYAIGSCSAYTTVTVAISPAPISGVATLCSGSTTVLSDAVSGGSWTSGNIIVATIGSSTGIVTGLSAGTSIITYAIGGCKAITTVTVNPLPGPISGTTFVCQGSATTLSDATSGGVWSSSSSSVATVSTGIVTGVSAGTALITYSLSSGCYADVTITVNPLPTISASLSSICSDNDTLTASGGTTYSWSPSTGLSCTTCAITTVNPLATTTYTVTGTSLSGCSDIATLTVNGDRIFGHITFGGPTPDTLDMKVWLVKFNPSDSSIAALDSTNTCVIDSITYYEFDTKPSGSYMVKGMLLFGNPTGSSGYVPTYSLSNPHWDSAATVTHTGASDSLHISMVYGTVPAGPGFIGGYVYSGAGKGTTGDAPVSGMLIFLEDAASHILSHTYTDGTGGYSFSNLAYGNYIIYPEDYGYKTTYAAITINDAYPSATSIDFRQFLTSKVIIPYTFPNGIRPISSDKGLMIFPNPTSGELNIQWANQQTGNADIEITDVIGRKIYKSVINMNVSSGQVQVNVSGLNEGVYMITIKSDDIYYCGKLMIRK